MLRIQRNSIYILLPLCVVSLLVSALLNAVAHYNSWLIYGSNVLLGIFGSSLLALIVAIIGYCQEKHFAFEMYLQKIEKMITAISKYQQCDVNNSEALKANIELLKGVLFNDTRELGDIFAKFAFCIDRKKIIPYLFGYYQYFVDIKDLIRDNIRLLDNNVKAQPVLNYIDIVLLDISMSENREITFTEIKNKVFEDLYYELDALVKLANGRKCIKMRFGDKYEFKKTVLNDKIFKIENANYEQILHKIKIMVERENNFTISFTDLTEENLQYLWDNQYICGKTTTNEGKLTAITVTNKAYNYFRFKEHYEIGVHVGNE